MTNYHKKKKKKLTRNVTKEEQADILATLNAIPVIDPTAAIPWRVAEKQEGGWIGWSDVLFMYVEADTRDELSLEMKRAQDEELFDKHWVN